MTGIKISLYESQATTKNETKLVEDYINMVKFGQNQNAVLAARKAKSEGDTVLYKKIKVESMCVTPTGTFESGKQKVKDNLMPNGLICIDIDTDVTESTRHSLYNDKYTYIAHRSFGGDGICVWVKIDASKLDDAYLAISKYYKEEYGIQTDMSCSNSNRIRYVSYDHELVHFEKSLKFNVKVEKKDRAPINTSFVFTNSDFDNILEQIRDRSIDLCDEDYYKYVRIGLALASQFGEAGRAHFHFICQYGSKYKQRAADRDYDGFSRNRNGDKTTIGTFYYYCQEAGLEIYTERTKTIINRVKVSKSQGSPTVDSVVTNLRDANKIDATEADLELIETLINSTVDFSKNANKNLTDIEQLANFIVDYCNPRKDEVTQITYIHNNHRMTDSAVNDIYINCLKNFDFKVSKSDVRDILNSSYVARFNTLNDFINDNRELTPSGYIDAYAALIYPQTEYNKWAFKKWLIGALHNWTRDFNEVKTCPLTLVLSGQKHGTGKTSWFRNILPKQLSKYITETKIDPKDKDSLIRLTSSLIVLDDEFGGKAFKDEKAYKDISDKNIISVRRAYGKEDETLKRRAILCGTSNEVDILRDVTGNRRILPINVDRIDYEAVLKFDKTSLIMEAYHLLQDGFEWTVFSDEDIEYIRDNTSQNQAVIPLEETFFDLFSMEHSIEYPYENVFNQGDILRILHEQTPFKPNKFDLKEIFVKNKLSYQSHRIGGSVKTGVKLYSKKGSQQDPPF